ncbi:hypothetical protein NW853_13490, partial [Synechococcus sp. H55.11]
HKLSHVLNALRQSKENHQKFCGHVYLARYPCAFLRVLCSTPYGNQRKIILREQEVESDLIQCSTPYGNQRKIIGGRLLQLQISIQCSTPYGNQRKIIRPTGHRALTLVLCSTPYGNQRKIIQAKPAQRQTHKTECSTPYGNQRKIILTGLLPTHVLALVLNALRQSKENHGF